MKIRFLLYLAALAGLLAVSAQAADVTGKWVAKMEGKDGQTFEQVFNLKADGATLTGTVSGRGGETPITDGKINGDDISFNVSRETQRGTMKMSYTGKVSGDELKLTMQREGGQGQGREITAKKAQ